MEISNCKLHKQWMRQEGCTVARHLVGSILLWKPGFSPSSVHVGYVENKVAPRWALLWAFGFLLVSIIPSVLPTALCLAPFSLSVSFHLCCPFQFIWHHSACQYHSICAAHCSLSGTIQPVSIILSVLPTTVSLAPCSLSVSFHLCCPFQFIWHHSAFQYHSICAAHCSLSGTSAV